MSTYDLSTPEGRAEVRRLAETMKRRIERLEWELSANRKEVADLFERVEEIKRMAGGVTPKEER